MGKVKFRKVRTPSWEMAELKLKPEKLTTIYVLILHREGHISYQEKCNFIEES